MNDEDALKWMVVLLGLVLGVFICLMQTGCGTASFNRERPVVEIYTILGGNLWRKQVNPPMVKGLGLAEGWLCLSPNHMELLLNACTEPTIPAR